LLGQPVPTAGIAGGPAANGTYLGRRLTGTTKIAFLRLNNLTRIEILAGDPAQASWWRDVYVCRRGRRTGEKLGSFELTKDEGRPRFAHSFRIIIISKGDS
jgi:hypothetical protein